MDNEQVKTSKSEKTYICENFYKSLLQDKAFSKLIQLFTHDSFPDGGKYIVCGDCHNTFLTLSCLKAHTRTHTKEKPLNSSYCENTFTQHLYMKKNQQNTHTLDFERISFSCSECEESFDDASVLKLHMKVHTREKSFKCKECTKSFSFKHLLTKHTNTHRQSVCSICTKSFAQLSGLTVHMRIHTGQKPFDCSQCNKSYTGYGDLMKHKRLHTGEKPFACLMCQKRFSLGSSLKVHKRVHTKERPYNIWNVEKVSLKILVGLPIDKNIQE